MVDNIKKDKIIKGLTSLPDENCGITLDLQYTNNARYINDGVDDLGCNISGALSLLQ
jgi:hypothetical protein